MGDVDRSLKTHDLEVPSRNVKSAEQLSFANGDAIWVLRPQRRTKIELTCHVQFIAVLKGKVSSCEHLAQLRLNHFLQFCARA